MVCDMSETVSERVEQANTEATRPRLLLGGFFPFVCYGFALSFLLNVVAFLQMSHQIGPSLTKERARSSLPTYLNIVCVKMLLVWVRNSTKGTFDTTLGLVYRTGKHADIGIYMLFLMLFPIRFILV